MINELPEVNHTTGTQETVEAPCGFTIIRTTPTSRAVLFFGPSATLLPDRTVQVTGGNSSCLIPMDGYHAQYLIDKLREAFDKIGVTLL